MDARLGEADGRNAGLVTVAPQGETVAREIYPQEKQLEGRPADALAAVLMAFVAMQTVGVVMIPVVTPFLQERFSVSDAQIGLLTSAFALAVALASIPMGLSTARWGGRTLVAAAALFLAGSLVLAVAGSYEWLLAGRFIQGLGAGAGMPVGTALITRLVSPAWRHRAFGLFGAGTGVGTFMTLLILPTVAGSAATVRCASPSRCSASASALPRSRCVRSGRGRCTGMLPLQGRCSARLRARPGAAVSCSSRS